MSPESDILGDDNTVVQVGGSHNIVNVTVGAGTRDLGIALTFKYKIRAFLNEYLTSETGEVPFGGRDAELKRLEGLPPDPNPLAGFNRPARLTSQTEPTLDQLGSDLSLERQTEYNFRRLFDQTTTFVGTGHRDSLKRDIAIPQTVLEQFAYLDNRCASRIRKIVGAAEYGEGRSKVLAALGQPAFEEYSQQIEAERFGSETLNPWGALGSRRFPGELGPGLHDPLLEPRVEPKIEPRIEPHVEFVP